VRVAVYADNLDLFDPSITLKNKHKGDVYLATMDGVTNKDQADALKGTKLYCDRDALPDLTEDEVYFADLIGMTCVQNDGTPIGTVLSVDNFGAGDLLNIKPPKGADFYLSYDDKTVLSIDDHKITIQLPEVI